MERIIKPMETEYTVEQIVKEMNAGIKEFGRYSFFDKGPDEVMDLSPVIEWLYTKDPEFAGSFLTNLRGKKSKKDSFICRNHLAISLLERLNCMDCPWTQEQWDVLEEHFDY
jgi:hypothetical protein